MCRYTFSEFTLVGHVEFVHRPSAGVVSIVTSREINKGAAGRFDLYGYTHPDLPEGPLVEEGEDGGEDSEDGDGGLNFEMIQLHA
jgi:hypothetical protein